MSTLLKAALYLRVSTDGQTTGNQRLELEKIAHLAGWKIAGVYEDDGISGAKGRDERPAYNQLLKDANRRKFDIVMAWSVDRLGRSLQDLVAFLAELQSLNIDLYLSQQGLDTTTPSGKAMFQMCGVFAEFEHSLIQQRVKAGLNKARANGIKLGRPKVPDIKKSEVIRLKSNGSSVRAIAKETGLSVGSVHKIIKAA